MNDLLRLVTAASQFPPTSRYHAVGTAETTLADGRRVTYLLRRFVPRPEGFTPLLEHRVREGDRLDLLAGEYYGESLLAWRLCDANRAMRPSDLTDTPGATLRVVAPEDPQQGP